MQSLTSQGEAAVKNLAQRYNLGPEAVKTMLFAVNAGGGSMAQFYCSELGGGGQWMRGGMTMVGDMFDHGLAALVNDLCSDLSLLLASSQVIAAPAYQDYGNGFVPGNNWRTSGSSQSHDEILSALERLGTLQLRGLLSDQEFQSKKTELLARL